MNRCSQFFSLFSSFQYTVDYYCRWLDSNRGPLYQLSHNHCPSSNFSNSKDPFLGSGCGRVDSAAVSDARAPGFESCHWQLLLNNYLPLNVYRKDGKKEKEGGNGPFLNRSVLTTSTCLGQLRLAKSYFFVTHSPKTVAPGKKLNFLQCNCSANCY